MACWASRPPRSERPTPAGLGGLIGACDCASAKGDPQVNFSACENQTQPSFKLVYDTVKEKRFQICYESVRETVMKPVTRTCYRDECKTCYKPVKCTEYRTIQETICRPCVETVMKAVPYSTCKPVVETRMEQRCETVCFAGHRMLLPGLHLHRLPQGPGDLLQECTYTVCRPHCETHRKTECYQACKTVCESCREQCRSSAGRSARLTTRRSARPSAGRCAKRSCNVRRTAYRDCTETVMQTRIENVCEGLHDEDGHPQGANALRDLHRPGLAETDVRTEVHHLLRPMHRTDGSYAAQRSPSTRPVRNADPHRVQLPHRVREQVPCETVVTLQGLPPRAGHGLQKVPYTVNGACRPR